MVGGGIEATGGRDQFTGVFHTEKHFATSLVVVAGGGEDGGDGLGCGTVMEEVEDGLSLGRMDGAAGEAGQQGMVVVTEEGEGW